MIELSSFRFLFDYVLFIVSFRIAITLVLLRISYTIVEPISRCSWGRLGFVAGSVLSQLTHTVRCLDSWLFLDILRSRIRSWYLTLRPGDYHPGPVVIKLYAPYFLPISLGSTLVTLVTSETPRDTLNYQYHIIDFAILARDTVLTPEERSIRSA